MRPSRARRRTLLILWVAFWLIPAALAIVFLLAPSARGDSLDDRAWMWIQRHGTEFCNTLAARPDLDGATTGARSIIAAGFGKQQTAEIIVWSVVRFCPQYQALLHRLSQQPDRQEYT